MTGVSASAETCYTGTLMSGFNTLTADDVMEAVWPQVKAALGVKANKGNWLTELLQNSGTCQLQCFQTVTDQTYRALYGKLGPDYVSESVQIKRLFTKAVAGAFAACFPTSQRNGLLGKELQLAGNIVKSTENPGAPVFDKYPLPDGLACMNEGKEVQFPIDGFMMGFKKELNMLMSEDVYFAKSCQKDCLLSAVETSVMTLFRTNNEEDDVIDHAISGAIHACLPEVTPDSVNSLVASSKLQLQAASTKASQAPQVCYGGAIKAGGALVKKAKFMKNVEALVVDAIVKVADEDKDLYDYIKNSGVCKVMCLVDMQWLALSTLYGKLGVHFMSESKLIQEQFDEALVGAFKACYPGEKEASMIKSARTLVKSIDKTQKPVGKWGDLVADQCKHAKYAKTWEKKRRRIRHEFHHHIQIEGGRGPVDV
jgi:hypothetical protein